MLEVVLDLRAGGDLGILVAVQGGWCRYCLAVFGWYLVVWLGLWHVCLGFLGSQLPVEWTWAVLPRGSYLLGRGARRLFPPDLQGGLWVLVSLLVFCLCYWGACRGA